MAVLIGFGLMTLGTAAASNVITADPRIYGRIYVGTNGHGIFFGDTAGTAPPVSTMAPTSTTAPTTTVSSVTAKTTSTTSTTGKTTTTSTTITKSTSSTTKSSTTTSSPQLPLVPSSLDMGSAADQTGLEALFAFLDLLAPIATHSIRNVSVLKFIRSKTVEYTFVTLHFDEASFDFGLVTFSQVFCIRHVYNNLSTYIPDVPGKVRVMREDHTRGRGAKRGRVYTLIRRGN